ncbi:ABC transporter substrate-binding protein [Sphaerimonospora sp. CA-214678]|uniref:ABC transporter substrate-binding protein n=1 Tax=Sphaerimonospora sp. CA-214678 TaxID=3240029 RepID=UPI003D906F38
MTHAPRVSRRRSLRLGLLTATAVTVLPLAACGGEASQPRSQSATPISTVLRVGAADATNSTGLDPRTASSGASIIVMRHVYDSLMVLDGDEYQLALAESVQPNTDATRWTVRIRDGVKFHDGRPVRAADVAYSLRTLATPPSNRASVYQDVDATKIKVIDERTVEIPLKHPRADFPESTLVVYSPIFPDGTTDFGKAIGSGPYRLDQSDDRAVLLTATGTHWSGPSTVRQLEISRIADPAARLNAVKSGQIDYAVGISAAGAQAERSNPALTVQRGGPANSSALSFAMNQRLEPFDDPRVRRAVRLAADRQALVDNALLGFGSPADDVVGKGLPGYAAGIGGRTRDVATARKLFQEAGVTELTLRAGEIVPGMMSAARLLAQQLEEAGVKLTVQEVPADTYYADLKSLATHPFQAFYYSNRPAAVHLAAVTHKTAPFNVTGTGPDHWKRLAAAQVTTDDAERARAFEELQLDLYESGGDLLWGFAEQLDLSRAGVTGVRVSQSIPMFDRAALGQ